MFCFKCGTQLPDGSCFCMKCGAKMPDAESQTEITEPPAPEDATPHPFEKTVVFGAGSSITVNNMTMTCKDFFVAETIALGQIYNLQMRKGSIIDNGMISFEVDKKKHIYRFPKKQNQAVEEIYHFLLNANPLASEPHPAPAPVEPIARCPKCGSTSLTANKKGFGVGKAVVGVAIAAQVGLAPIGLVGGNIGKDKVLITCLHCGHQYKP